VNLIISIGFIFREGKNFYQNGGFRVFQRIGKYKVMILDDAKYAGKSTSTYVESVNGI
jgi:hypothetical protein